MKALALINCTLKKRYPSKEKAREAADYIWTKWEDNLDVYHCNICEGYHLTGKTNEQARKR